MYGLQQRGFSTPVGTAENVVPPQAVDTHDGKVAQVVDAQ
jgi:hypothetical protein